jgi:hypothetical protein
LRKLDVAIEPYHVVAGAIEDSVRALWELKLDIAIPAAAKALGSKEAAENLARRFLSYLDREDTLTYSVVFTVVGTKP